MKKNIRMMTVVGENEGRVNLNFSISEILTNNGTQLSLHP
jgi:hypothetical protein